MLEPEGFTRRGRRFFYDAPAGGRAFLEVRPWPLSHQPDISAHADLFLQPPICVPWSRALYGPDADEAQIIDVFKANSVTWVSLMANEVRQTGRGVLVGLTLDNDFLGDAGAAPDGSMWSGAVDREAAADHRQAGLAEEYDNVVPEFPTDATASTGAAAWARANRLDVDLDALERLFDMDPWKHRSDSCWWELLEALELTSKSE